MKEKRLKILTFPLRIALIILIFGALFKLMHWPYAQQLMLIASVSISLLYTIRFFNKTQKQKLDYIKLALVLVWVFSYLNEVFHLFYFPYILEVCLFFLFAWWCIADGFSYFKNRKFKKNKVTKVIYTTLKVVTIVFLVFGMLFKIQHWAYGSELFVLGVLLLCSVLILDYFIVEQTS